MSVALAEKNGVHSGGASALSRLRVMTYNIHHGRGTDGKYDLERIATTIAGENPDIVALQEIEQFSKRTGGDDQPRLLAERLGLTPVFVPVRKHCADPRAGYGNAILSRFPVTSSELFCITHPELRWERRGCLRAELDVGGSPLHVFCVHLGLRRRERHHQIEKLLSEDIVRNERFGAGPKILLGDFNNWWPVKSAKLVDEHFRNACVVTDRRRHATFNGVMNVLCLDYIFTSPELPILDYYVKKTGSARVASDHRPVVCDIGWQAAGEEVSQLAG